MGMFDSVWIPCPKCGTDVEFQSKGGECLLISFTLDTAPPRVIADILGDTGWCTECKHGSTLYGVKVVKQAVFDDPWEEMAADEEASE